MSHFDIAAEQRRIEVERALPVRVVPVAPEPNEPDLPTDLHLILCGSCGVRLTFFDPRTGLVSMERWTIKGWTWRPVRGHHQARDRKAGTSLAVATGDWLRNDHRIIAKFPITKENGWRRPDLPAVLHCYRCGSVSALTTKDLSLTIRS